MTNDDSWWPAGYDLPAFRVKRQTYGLMNGGDWVRGSSVETLAHTALRYPTITPEATAVAEQSLLYVRPFDYHTTEILWGWPASYSYSDQWEEVALVRSTFGHPSTPQDGITVFRADRSEFEAVEEGMVAPPTVYDQPLPSGYWYYYTLFFRVNQLDWVAGMSDGCVLPRDFLHREYLWDAVPPYYQWIDDQNRAEGGPLRRFLTIFGFSLDNTRELVEGVLDLHRLDRTPMPLLKGLGANYGLPHESGIGDIRYRGLVANAPNAQHTRGTARGLQQVIEAVSKYETSITGSETIMLLPDDSDFHNTTGNWGGIHPEAYQPMIAQEVSLSSAAWDKVFLARVNKQAHVGRGVMRAYTSKADELASFIVLVGDSRIPVYRDADGDVVHPEIAFNPGGSVQTDTVPAATTEYRDAIPLTSAISVTAGIPYGFSIWVQAPEKAFTIQPLIFWLGSTGNPEQIIDISLGNLINVAQSTSQWTQVIAQGTAPVATTSPVAPEARYMVPGFHISARVTHTTTVRSAGVDVCGAMTYRLGDEDSQISVIPPDRYLTMGDPGEKLGATKSGFEGFVMGSPKKGA